MFAMSVLEQRRFPVPAAPTIRHPGGAELSVARLQPGRPTNRHGLVRRNRANLGCGHLTGIVPLPAQTRCARQLGEFSPDGRSLATCSDDKNGATLDVAYRQGQVGARCHGRGRDQGPVQPRRSNLLIRTKLSVCVLRRRAPATL